MKFTKSSLGWLLLAFGLCYGLMTYWTVGESIVTTIYAASMPFLGGAAIAYIVNIVMSAYEGLMDKLSKGSFKHKRAVALPLAYLTFVFVMVGIFAIVLPDLIRSLQVLLQINTQDIQSVFNQIQENELVKQAINALGIDLNSQVSSLVSNATQQLSQQFLSILTNLLNSMTSLTSGALNLFVSIIFSFYVLGSKETLARQFNLLFATFFGKYQRSISFVRQILHESFRNFFVSQTLEAIILGSLCAIGMLILGLPYAATVGILLAFTALIPVVGGFIGLTIGAILILTQSLSQALIFVVFLLILQQLEGNLIYPKVVGNSIGLPGMWVLMSITIGGALMGILGMLIAVPIAATLYKLLRHYVHRRQEKATAED